MDDRFDRQLRLPEIGFDGQKKLEKAKVLVVGAGGLGSPALYYLASAGVGTIGICDYDVVSVSNLNRQILHFENDIGIPKAESAKRKLTEYNSDIDYVIHEFKLDEKNAVKIIKDYDIVLSCVDNFSARVILNDAHITTKIPLIDAGIQGFSGYVFPIINGHACYRCVFPKDVEKEKVDGGVIGATAGIIGCTQAMQAIKYILGLDKEFYGNILFLDFLSMSFDIVKVDISDDCLCQKK